MFYEKFFILFVIFCLNNGGVLAKQIVEGGNRNARTFAIDWDNNTFIKDGEPFRFIAGSFHYFRAHEDSWQRKLRTMRAAGLNAVTTYVEWSLHNPKEGVYKWEGMADLERFVKLAEQEDLYVILRPGPYICAERDLGGFPYWILKKYPDIKLREYDEDYLYEVRVWYSKLMKKMEPLLYGNGGPIIMVQVENEYGSFRACDHKYGEWLRDETLIYTQDKAVLFTNDGPGLLKCGQIKGVLATLDFGAVSDLPRIWAEFRQDEPKGPLVNAEYYPGWLTHWGEHMSRVQTSSITKTFTDMLDDGANVNFYMFFGGTNFGFTAGANSDGHGNNYVADVTSYDYDAPMNEAGDPTEKFFTIRKLINKYLPLPNITVPEPIPKKNYGSVELMPTVALLSKKGRQLTNGHVINDRPLTFEDLDQNAGLVLYETRLPKIKRSDINKLNIENIHDRAYVYVDNQFLGVLSRNPPVKELNILNEAGRKLQILVESQGRINYNVPNDRKGIIGDVKYNNLILKNFTMYKYPMEDGKELEKFVEQSRLENGFTIKEKILRKGPVVFYGELNVEKGNLGDTYLDATGWGKGLIFINGFNLGRYWPSYGPQVTLYVPSEVLKEGINKIVLVEYQTVNSQSKINFTDVPNLDG